MRARTFPAALGLLAVLGAAPAAVAQYYPPPGYGPRLAFGGRCASRLPTAYGPRRLVCPIRLRPLGRPCVCPPPAPPPGYPPGPYLNGRVVP